MWLRWWHDRGCSGARYGLAATRGADGAQEIPAMLVDGAMIYDDEQIMNLLGRFLVVEM